MITNIEFRAQMEDLIKKINSSYVKSLDPTVDDYESINYETFKKEFEALIDNYTSGGGASSADAVSYDNTDSGLEATDVQGAIDELAEGGGGGSSLYVVKFTVTIDMSTGQPSVTCDKPLSEIWQKRPEEIFAYYEAPAFIFLMDRDFPENWWSSQEEMMSAKFYGPVTVSNIMPGIEACFTTCALTIDWNEGTFSGMDVHASVFDEDNVFYIIGLPTDSTGTDMVKGGTVDNWIFTQYSEPTPTPTYEIKEAYKLNIWITPTSPAWSWVNIATQSAVGQYIKAANNSVYGDNPFYRGLLNNSDYQYSNMSCVELILNPVGYYDTASLRGGTLYKLYDDVDWVYNNPGENAETGTNGGTVIFGATERVNKYDTSTSTVKEYVVHKRLFMSVFGGMDINSRTSIDGGSPAPGELSNINYTEKWIELT